jgi:hypothetical protein
MAIVFKIGAKSFFLKIKCILEGSYAHNAHNLKKAIMNFLFSARGLTKAKMLSRLLSFGVDGVNTFQGALGGVIVQI